VNYELLVKFCHLLFVEHVYVCSLRSWLSLSCSIVLIGLRILWWLHYHYYFYYWHFFTFWYIFIQPIIQELLQLLLSKSPIS